MEPEASPFETFEMLAAVLTSAPLLSRSWQICSVATATAPNGFLMESLGDVGYVGFSSIQILAGGSNQNYRDMVPLNTSSEGLFSPLYRNKEGEEPPMVHAGMLHLFMSMFKSSDFQDQMAAIMRNSKSIIITGHSIGGTTASLCALWLLSYLQTISSTMSVLCITFGSPLLGNEAFSKATLQERWGGNFCHVVSKQDIMPRLLFAPVESLTAKLHSLVHFWHMSFTSPDYQKLGIQLPKKDQDDLFHFVKAYLEMAAAAVQEDEVPSPNVFRPFGSYVFVSEEGAVCVDGAKAVTKMMNAIYADSNPSCSINDHLKYGDYISKVCAQFMQQRNSVRWKIPDSSYEAGLELALQSSGISSQEESVLIYAKECLRMARKRMGRAPTLNAANLAVSLAKINPYRAQIEWYKATCDESDDQMGYYDSFKRRASKRDMRVNVNRMRLARFWDDVIEMLEDNQLPHDFDKRAKWFNASQSYKLLVEPLDIAEYYRKGTHKEKGHYMKHGRERRYSIFDKWWKNRTVPAEDINQRSKFANLTQDSCFWAKVEEARDWLDSAKRESDVSKLALIWVNIEDFEKYAGNLVENKEVSADVLAKNSSYTQWVEELSELKKMRSHAQNFHHQCTRFLDGEVVP